MAQLRISRRLPMISFENGVIVALLALAVLLVVPAVRMLTSSSALTARKDLALRLMVLEKRAQRERTMYSVTFTPSTGRMDVYRWSLPQDGVGAQPVRVEALSRALPDNIIVERCTLPDHTLVISDSGFALSSGQIVLRAPDQTTSVLDMRELSR